MLQRGSPSDVSDAEHAGQGETELGYIAACLIVPAPSDVDGAASAPFAIPSAEGVDVEGCQLWRTEEHWTAADLEEARRFLGPLLGGGGHQEEDEP